MNKIYQYRPSFFDGFKQESGEFNNLNELKAIPFVANFSNNKDFLQFSKAENGHYLFAEYMERKKHTWYCVGWFELNNEGCITELPELICSK